MRFILASGSPRRREILSVAGYEYEVLPSSADELTNNYSAQELAVQNATAKAIDVYSKTDKDAVILGADTVVCLDGEILGKPKDAQDAYDMLRRLSGSSHSVITGYAVVGKNGVKSGYCETYVSFRDISDDEIRAYIATNEPMDKAGGYGIQEKGCLFASSVTGDFFNVIGLPVSSVRPLLAEYGVFPVWMTK